MPQSDIHIDKVTELCNVYRVLHKLELHFYIQSTPSTRYKSTNNKAVSCEVQN